MFLEQLARQRQLFKNIMYVGALSALLQIDPAVVETLLSEQYKGKEKLLDSNVQALELGREHAAQHPAPAEVGEARERATLGVLLVGGDATAHRHAEAIGARRPLPARFDRHPDAIERQLR